MWDMLQTSLWMVVVILYMAIGSGNATIPTSLINTDSWQALSASGTRGVVWSPSNHYLAIARLDGMLVISDQMGNQIRALQASDGALYTVAWSPDGSLLASGGDEALIRIWHVESGELVHELPVLMDGVTSLAWQPTGDILLAAGNDRFQAWSTVSWEPITEPLSVTLQDVRWSPDGSRFGFAALDQIGTAIVNETNVDVSNVSTVSPIPYSVNWSADGNHLLSAGGTEGSVRLWDANTSTQLAVLLQTDQTVTDAIFVDAAGTQIVAITDEGTAYLIDVPSAEVLEEHVFPASLWRAAWNPQANLLAISGKPNEVSGESSFLNISLPNFELPPTPTPTPTLTPTPTPSATPTPAAFQRLRVTAMCSDDPATSRRWRIRNPNPYPVPFTWEMHNSPGGQQGTGTAPVAVNGVPSAVILTTPTERWIPVIEVTANGRSDYAVNLGIPCDWPSPPG